MANNLNEIKASIHALKVVAATTEILMDSEGDFTDRQKEIVLTHLNVSAELLDAVVGVLEKGDSE